MDYPVWMYHAEQGAKLFKTAEELDAAGGGWADHPEKAKQDTPSAPVVRAKKTHNRKG